jgi:ABC-type transport system substrate-binding protein
MGRGVRWVALLFLIGACSTNPPTPTPAAPSATALRSEPITMHSYGVRSVSNVVFSGGSSPLSDLRLVRMVHTSLYRYDASLAALPDLAAEPCAVADDLVTVTCTLRPGMFHDGSRVTSADVAYTYGLANSTECRFVACLVGRLREITAVDERTVRFVLQEPYAPFLTTGLADLFVEPRTQIETAFAAFAEQASGTDTGELDAIRQRLRAGLEAPELDCESQLEPAEAALREAGIEPSDRSLFVVLGGTGFDACSYADHLMLALDSVSSSIRATGFDAVAAVYPFLPFATMRQIPVGAGPWRIAQFGAAGLTLARHESYHGTLPAIPEIRVRTIQEDDVIQGALADGSLDWLPDLLALGEEAVRDTPGIRIARYPSFAYGALQFNVRDGRLFADRNLRQAVTLCIDKERIVEASTPGATAIYSPIPPGSWAYQPGLARERDVDAARLLIQASGWAVGSDGIYERDGSRLAAEVVLRADIPPVLAIVDRIVSQVRDCGIELTPHPVVFPDALRMIVTPPHLAPSGSEPFDVYFGGWSMGFDPDVSDIFHSRSIPSEPEGGLNYIGFSNPRVDDLLDEGLRTYDRPRRAEIYRELQRVLDEEQPYLFMAAIAGVEAIDDDMTSTPGELQLNSPEWWWQLEALVNPGE